jgi:hypothetical protein
MSAVIAPSWPWAPDVAPEWLKQSFNNGWTFGNVFQVSNENSSGPEIEREVVSKHSYGRQLGRLIDAMVAISESLPAAAKDPRVRELLALAKDIERIKREARQKRSVELLQELQELKRSDKQAWAKLMTALDE